MSPAPMVRADMDGNRFGCVERCIEGMISLMAACAFFYEFLGTGKEWIWSCFMAVGEAKKYIDGLKIIYTLAIPV
ncbi:hypothetical protein KDH_77040 [Dictyobacter sp. S3.2.2.5]|uniref:Uncharacterized protein n=1 Tax=Dictyobacter halimunensis TaxID=3026934 RepID=A0ABQ6G4S8_9CHLR|nr:hypothetical protein KDH_77040 [Dictyobacter sp. S3.2.2.5]